LADLCDLTAVPLLACLSRHSAERDGGSTLVPLRRAVSAVARYAQGLSVLARPACGRPGIRFPDPPQGACYGNSRQRRPAVLVSHVFPGFSHPMFAVT